MPQPLRGVTATAAAGGAVFSCWPGRAGEVCTRPPFLSFFRPKILLRSPPPPPPDRAVGAMRAAGGSGAARGGGRDSRAESEAWLAKVAASSPHEKQRP
eukprot:scaffold13947_cov108-Isochrysis_galbana.AAC.5